MFDRLTRRSDRGSCFKEPLSRWSGCLFAICVLSLSILGCSYFGLGKPKLEGSPTDTGLLVIDVQAGFGWNWSVGPGSPAIKPENYTHAKLLEAAISAGPGSRHVGRPLHGHLIVFSNLEPGTYHLGEIRVGRYWDDQSVIYSYSLPGNEPVTIDVTAGQSQYIGQFRIKDDDELPDAPEPGQPAQSHRSRVLTPDILRMDESAEHERAALQVLLKAYEKSAWAQPLRNRLSALGR